MLKEAFGNAKGLFGKVWMKLAAVQVTSLLVMFLVLGLIMGVFFASGSISIDDLQNLFINLQFNGDVDTEVIAKLAGAGGLAMLLLIILGSLGQVASWQILRANEKNEKLSPFRAYFVTSWNDLWSFLGLVVRMGWYVFWRVLLLVLVFGLVMAGVTSIASGGESSNIAITSGSIGGVIMVIFILFWAAKVMLWQPVYFLNEKQVKPTISKAKSLIKEDTTKKLMPIFILMILMAGLGQIVGMLGEYVPQNVSLGIMGVYQIISLFIIAPFFYAFLWSYAKKLQHGSGNTENPENPEKNLPNTF